MLGGTVLLLLGAAVVVDILLGAVLGIILVGTSVVILVMVGFDDGTGLLLMVGFAVGCC